MSMSHKAAVPVCKSFRSLQVIGLQSVAKYRLLRRGLPFGQSAECRKVPRLPGKKYEAHKESNIISQAPTESLARVAELEDNELLVWSRPRILEYTRSTTNLVAHPKKKCIVHWLFRTRRGLSQFPLH